MKFICMFAALAFSLRAQTFEAASVKPVPLPYSGDMSLSGGPGTPDPGQITWHFIDLFRLIVRAYDVGDDQVLGPSWMAGTDFSIVAKIPGNTSAVDFQTMLRNLLAERFHLKVHHENKEGPGYDLVVTEKGPKMKRAPDNEGRADVRVSVGGGNSQVHSDNYMTMAELADWLGRGGMINLSQRDYGAAVGAIPVRPRVVDRTGLSGKFDFTLDFAGGYSFDLRAQPKLVGSVGSTATDPAGGTTIFSTLERQLGLRLAKTKDVPLDVIVVDHVDKVPTEN